jgi:putative hydrolase of the HAD superfamily
MTKRYTTIISDLGGVFLNRGIWLFWDYLHEKNNVPIEISKNAFLKNYKQYFSGKISEKDFWYDFVKETNLTEDWHLLREKLLNLFEINKDMAELYTNLRNKGFKVVLLSDQSKEWWPILDEKYKISSYFDFVIVSAIVGLHKPDPEIYKYALKESDSMSKECIFTDDLSDNLFPAKELGIETILFENSKQFKKELQKRVEIQ